MIAAIQTTMFDYAALDTETRIVVQQRTSEIKALMKRAASDIIEIGQKLIEVKARLEATIGYGHFGKWLETEFDWSDDTAGNFMRVARRFGDFPKISESFAPSALYLLSAPSTPENARIESIARAEQGEPISYTSAREIINNHRNGASDLTPDEEDELEHIEERRYDGWPTDTPPEEDRREAQRRQQIAVITGSSESNEWYTPTHIIEQAREALGGIDFDPASSAAANAVVQADAYCTIAENGYAQPWYGKVWLNPPYGKEEGETATNAVRWSRKLIAEYEEGRVEAAILLIKAALGYNWFEELWRLYPTCLLRERLSFVRPDGSDDGQSKHATALLYIGPDAARFRAAFQSLGRIILPD